MQRIIISEVDNTSNVEALSSYDVVYVPGFSNNGASPVFSNGATLFRTPTLVTSKYEFLKLYGNNGVDDCPTFPVDQPYPIAGESTYGFPSFAIPGYVPKQEPAVITGVRTIEYDLPSTSESIINAITDTGFYVSADETNPVDSDWRPTEGTVYYVATLNENGTPGIATMNKLSETGSYTGLYIFTSQFVPSDNSWMIEYNDQFIYTDDTYIEFDSNGVVKEYRNGRSSNTALMFQGPHDNEAGDPDPGYRYALYLLSLGIPIYYEQMNSSFVAVDKNDPTYTSANPSSKGWFEEFEGKYIRTSDGDTKTYPNKIYYMGADISIQSMYEGLTLRFDDNASESGSDYSFGSFGDYAIKYITSGGYPTFEYGPLASDMITGTSPLAEKMIRLASKRQDSVALIDHTNNPNRTIYPSDTYSVVTRVRDEFRQLTTEVGSYGAMFTPWYECTHDSVTGGDLKNYGSGGTVSQMPASLAFLSALSQQLRNYNPWLAVAGVSRGLVPYCGKLHTNYTLTNNVADSYQVIPGDVESLGTSSISINPITEIRNYGYCIWGNRTLRNNSDGTKATSFLNIRDMVSDIKKRLYEASQRLLFEQNTDVLWLNFKSLITPLLDSMVSNYILSDYGLVKYNIDPRTGAPVPSYKVLASVRIVPINSVEVFELKVELENKEVTVAEVE